MVSTALSSSLRDLRCYLYASNHTVNACLPFKPEPSKAYTLLFVGGTTFSGNIIELYIWYYKVLL